MTVNGDQLRHISLDQALDLAGRLWEDTPNEGAAAEYLRGMAELLGDIFPTPGITLDTRAPEIAHAIMERGLDR